MLAMFSQFLPALSKVTADTEANKTDCEEQTVKQLSPEQETNVVQEPVKTLPSLSKVTADAEANKTNCEKKTVQQLSLEQEINVVQKPVKTLQALSKVTADTVADKTNCEEKTVQQLSPEQKTNVVQEPVKTLECNQLQEMGQQRTDKQMLQDQTERDIQQIPKPSQNTWTACREAYDLIYQSPDIIEKPAQQPTTVPASVLRTLKGLCDPEFVSFVKTLTDHLQNDHRCAHPCFQFPSVAVEEMDSTNSYIELMNNALPLTSTPLKSTSCDFAASQPVLPKSCSSTAEPVVSPKPMTSFNLSSKKLIKHAESKPKVVTKLRRSPRKRQSTVKSTKPTNPKDMVKLLETSDVMIDRADKLEAIRMAKKPKNTGKEGYALMYNLLDKVFTLEELATSKGQGIGKRHQDHNDSRSVLDPEWMQVLKDFVSIWHSKNYPEKKNVSLNLNKAVTERISYARKKYTDTEGCFTPEEF